MSIAFNYIVYFREERDINIKNAKEKIYKNVVNKTKKSIYI